MTQRSSSKRIISRAGDVLDDLVWRHYGRSDVLAQVLEANLHLAQMPPVLAAGVVIDLPELPQPGEVPLIRLWS